MNQIKINSTFMKSISVFFSLLIISGSIVGIYFLINNQSDSYPDDQTEPSFKNTTESIVIKREIAFKNYTSKGKGTKDSPYIIEYFNITTTARDAILIMDITSYFVIRNCILKASSTGISIKNIAPNTAFITNNSIYNCGYQGIYVQDSNYVRIHNNCFFEEKIGELMIGIELRVSDFTLIDYNSFSKSYIRVKFSAEVEIQNNTFVDSPRYFLSMEWSPNSIINGNVVDSDNKGKLYIHDSTNTTISNNLLCGLGIQLGYFFDSRFEHYNVYNNWINGYKLGFFTKLENSVLSDRYGQIFLIDCFNVSIVNQRINNSYTAIEFRACSYCDILNSTLSNNHMGISIFDSEITNIENNLISSNYYGIYAIESPCTSIRNNLIEKNNGSGISLWGFDNATVINNVVSNNHGSGIEIALNSNFSLISNQLINNGLSFIGYECELLFSTSTIINNTVNKKPLGFFKNVRNKEIVDEYGQLIFFNCSDMKILNQQIEHVEDGIALYYSYNYTISNCSLNNINSNGLSLVFCSQIIISDNYFYNCSEGIFILFCENVNITTNKIFNCYNLGILIIKSKSMVIKCNSLDNNGYGICCHFTFFLTISENLIYNSTYTGIVINTSFWSTKVENSVIIKKYELLFGPIEIINNTILLSVVGSMLYGCVDVVVKDNNILNSSHIGLFLENSFKTNISKNQLLYCETGIQLNFSSNSNLLGNTFLYSRMYALSINKYSSNNVISYNNFIDSNMSGDSQAFDAGTNNIWYDIITLEGNYWVDWIGVGSYEIAGSSGSYDPYPLSEPV